MDNDKKVLEGTPGLTEHRWQMVCHTYQHKASSKYNRSIN